MKKHNCMEVQKTEADMVQDNGVNLDYELMREYANQLNGDIEEHDGLEKNEYFEQ